jgi:hypothetical protein
MIESYVDFVYLTKGGIPIAVTPLDYIEDQNGCYKVIIGFEFAIGQRRIKVHTGNNS